MNSKVVANLKPAEVFKYFGELSNVPRGSGNEKGVSDFLVDFAKQHKLEVIQDKAFNVIIKKPGTKGYENSPGVIIQGHMDMVCEKTADSTHDFQKDPLQLRVVDGEWLYATDTTLGGDDGIAVAMAMAILASDEIPHPPIELLVTTEEETGMDGAMALDPANITGSTLINIDSEEEGILTVSCAGGCTAQISVPLSFEEVPQNAVAFTIDINGLLGGHSGMEINKWRANANKLLGRLLYKAASQVRLVNVDGGSKHNAIPRAAQATVVMEPGDEAALKELVCHLEKTLKAEYKTADPSLCITVSPAKNRPDRMMTKKCSQNVTRLLYLIPDGVQSMSMDIPGLVESSLNLGVVRTTDDAVEMSSAIRSCVGSIKQNIYDHIGAIAALTDASLTAQGQYPEWQYDPESKLRKICIEQYESLFGQEPKVEAIHAGLECAMFAEKFGGRLDMISVGPTMVGVHTAEEHLNIPSTERTWEYLLAVLKSLK